jgi:hypothetical protein
VKQCARKPASTSSGSCIFTTTIRKAPELPTNGK